MSDDTTRDDRCPTCGQPLYPGPGMSRVDNRTLVCGRCSTLEAMLDMTGDWKSAVHLHWEAEKARARLLDGLAVAAMLKANTSAEQEGDE